MKHYLLYYLFLPLLLVSCSSDEDSDSPQVQPKADQIAFNLSIGDGITTRTSTDINFKTTWTAGDEVGIFACKAGTSLQATGNYIQNVKLTYDGTSWSGNLYWPTSAEGIASLDFYAYYPYDVSISDPTAMNFAVKVDQSTSANYNQSDLLTAKNAGQTKVNSVSLTFNHLLAMVQIQVPIEGKGFGPSEKLKVSLRGVKTKATLNLADINGTPGNEITLDATAPDAKINMYLTQTTSTDYTYRALIPVGATQNARLWFENEGQTPFIGENLSVVTTQAGQAEKYTYTLSKAIHTVLIPAGTFLMGSPATEPDRDSDETQHQVTLSKSFYMSKYQITNAQYASFLNANGIGNDGQWASGSYPSKQLIYASSGSYDFGLHYNTDKWEPVSGYENHPVIYVTWYGAMEYARWVGGSLPTEAQWEYACRTGTSTAYSYGNIADGDYMWYDTNSGSKTHAVGKTKPNVWGLYDMHGNVWEWCSDWYGDYDNYGSVPVTDPTGPTTSTFRVLRGGGWYSGARNCRSAFRYDFNPDDASNNIGFRVVFVP